MVVRLMYLVDTNVWLEVLLDQQHAGEARDFLQTIEADEIAVSEFTLYSIGIILTRLKKISVFLEFISEVLDESRIVCIRLDAARLREVAGVATELRLDFDDACQYVSASSSGCTLISFDSDFDRTPLGRKTPAQALAR
jgi:hypothetical protein